MRFQDNLIFEGSALNAFIAIKFLQLMTKPFAEWEAFKLGLIDGDGKKLKNAKTDEEKKNMTMFHIVVRNMKRLMGKIPGGKTKLASYAAGLWLIKEEYNLGESDVKLCLQYLIECLEKNNLEIEYPNVMENVTTLLAPNKYILDDNTMLIVREQKAPIGNIMGMEIYSAKNHITGLDEFFTVENIKHYGKNNE